MKWYLNASCLSSIPWWVDGSSGVHWDSKGHTGAMMKMGRGAIVNISRKHKMNVSSSTHSELVSIADVLGVIMWCKYFMEAQGYRLVRPLMATAALFSHAVSFTSYGPIPFTESSDDQ